MFEVSDQLPVQVTVKSVKAIMTFFGEYVAGHQSRLHETGEEKRVLTLFFLNNQPDALIIQIYSVINSTCFGHLLCPSSGVKYCTSGTGKFYAGFDERFQAESVWNCSVILTLLGRGWLFKK